MKAVILAGGFGTRLRPLSCTRPKLLFPILNQPLLDWTLKDLAKSGIEEVILAVNYMADAFVNRYGQSKYGMKLDYSGEEKPLGTGGAIKKAEVFINYTEPFFASNGDVFANINYKELARKHEENGALATIALHPVDDPSRYGTVELTESNKITRFVEKAARGREPSNLVNAGIYVLDPKIFSYIPSGRPVSIEREVFPKLAEEGRLYGYAFNGIWLDIGERLDYLKANRLLLDTQTERESLGKDVKVESDVKITPPIRVAENVVVGKSSIIGPYAVIGKNAAIGKGVSIRNSIVFPEARVSNFVSIKGAIVGEGVTLGEKVKIEDGCMVGDHVTVEDGVTLTKGVSVCPYRNVSESVLTPKCVM